MNASTHNRPVVIYDGECAFCQRWANRWESQIGDKVEVVASQDVNDRFPQISKEAYQKSVQFVECDGRVRSGADAVFRAMALGGIRRWPSWMYYNIPLAAWFSEGVYCLIARNREKLGCQVEQGPHC